MSTEPGKATLLQIMAGLEEPDEGTVTLGNEPGISDIFRRNRSLTEGDDRPSGSFGRKQK